MTRRKGIQSPKGLAALYEELNNLKLFKENYPHMMTTIRGQSVDKRIAKLEIRIPEYKLELLIGAHDE